MTINNIIRFSILAIMLIDFTISGYYRKKADQATGKTDFSEENQLLLTLRNIGALLMYSSILAYLIYPPILAWANISLSPIVRFLALAFMGLMVPAFLWMFSSLDKNITPTVTIREQHDLVTSGPYRWIRHPLYTFGFLNIFALALAANNWWILIIANLTLIPLLMRTPQEEEQLIQAFGEQYKAYMQVTGRYFPKSLRGAKDLYPMED